MKYSSAIEINRREQAGRREYSDVGTNIEMEPFTLGPSRGESIDWNRFNFSEAPLPSSGKKYIRELVLLLAVYELCSARAPILTSTHILDVEKMRAVFQQRIIHSQGISITQVYIVRPDRNTISVETSLSRSIAPRRMNN